MAKIECVFDASGYKVGLGEGPHWDDKNQRLLWVDIFDRTDETKGKTLHISDPATGTDQAIKFDVPVTSVVPRKNKPTSVAVTFQRNFAFVDLETGKLEIVKTVDDDKPGNRFNDGKCDAAGRYWAGTLGPEPVPLQLMPYQGSLFCWDVGASGVSQWNKGISLSNGLGWSTDNKTMYHIDTYERKVFAFDFDLAAGSVANRRAAIDVDEKFGWPDGLCVDNEDKVWVAMYDGGQVVRYDPMNGSVISSVKLPVSKITSCCWGGKNFDELFVTSAREYLSEEKAKEEPLAGSVFKVTNLGCKGMRAHEYDG
ncbi:regucalcin-like [Dendronephthya gigantea]|uniref:regucalcin-like n=1 Tax=Dendronephthya gigantea TaxID=151771 RepID=UPI001069122F|nr:regucalcin-like [Dendronephthya gigantea]